jgi:hypothetical protein
MNRGSGHTTALYLRAIADAIMAHGAYVGFRDHAPSSQMLCQHHVSRINGIAKKLKIDVTAETNGDTVRVRTNYFGYTETAPGKWELAKPHVSVKGCRCKHGRSGK